MTASVGDTRRGLILLALIVGNLMAVVDIFIVVMGLPSMVRTLGADPRTVEQAVSFYALPLAVLPVLGGWLADRFGRRQVYLVGLTLFVGASIGCGAAGRIEVLLAFRLVQGAGAALLIPTALAIISATFPPNRRGFALGVWGAASSLGALIGPLLGGVLVDTWGWPWIFFVNFPIGILTAVMIVAWLPSTGSEPASPKPSQWREFFNRRLVIACLGGFMMNAAVFGFIPFVSAFLQSYLGYTAFDAGIGLVPATVVVALSTPVMGIFAQRSRSLAPLYFVGAMSLSVAALLLLGTDIGSSYTDLMLPVLALLGFGAGALFSATSYGATTAVGDTATGSASGLWLMMRYLGTAVGVSLFGFVFESKVVAALAGAHDSELEAALRFERLTPLQSASNEAIADGFVTIGSVMLVFSLLLVPAAFMARQDRRDSQ